MNLVFAFVFLPLLTRPAAPRLATQGINLSVETCRPHYLYYNRFVTLFVPALLRGLTLAIGSALAGSGSVLGRRLQCSSRQDFPDGR